MPDKTSDQRAKNPEQVEKEYGLFDLVWMAFKDIPALMRTLKFAVWMIGILAAFTLAGTILPQQQFTQSTEAFRQQYIALFHLDPHGGGTGFGGLIYRGLVVPLQLYRVFETPLYLVLMCVLAISSTLCALDRLITTGRLLRRTDPEAVPAQIKGMTHSVEGTLPMRVEDARGKASSFLKAGHYRLFERTGDDGTIWMFGRKNAFKHYASAGMHLAFLFIIVGGIIRLPSAFGYEGTIRLGEGDTRPIGNELHRMEQAQKTGQQYQPQTADEIKLVEYENIYREREFHRVNPDTSFPEGYQGMPSDYVSRLQIIRSSSGREETVKEKAIEVNKPLAYDGVEYYQYAVDTNLTFTIDVPGEVPQTVETSLNNPRPLELPGLDIQCVVLPPDVAGGVWESADGTQTELPYSVRLRDYTKAGSMRNPYLVGYVSTDKPLSVEGVVIYLKSVKKYTILQYVHDPGVPLVGFGGLILALGMTIALYFPYKTVKILLRQKGTDSTYVAGSNWRGVTENLAKALGAKSAE